MAFRFSLSAVLEQRRAVEDRVQREYGEALARVERARAQLRELQAEVERRCDQVRRAQHQGLALLIRELHESWIESRREEARRLTPIIDRLSAEAEKHRLRLVRAVQDRTVMEKLRDEEMREWRLAEERAERRRFDEIAIRNFADEQRREKNSQAGEHHPERIAG